MSPRPRHFSMEATEHSLGPQTTPTPFVPFKPTEQRYWELRHLLWSRFDAGIRMDEEGWYSVTAVLMLVACFLLFLLRLGAPLIAARGFLAFRFFLVAIISTRIAMPASPSV